MTGLAEWLLEAITDDEEVARGVYSLSMYWRTTTGGHDFGPGVAYFEEPADAMHVARWSPARVLAECAAKRKIIEIHSDRYRSGCTGCGFGSDEEPMNTVDECPTLHALAAPYSDRPGFREEWRV